MAKINLDNAPNAQMIKDVQQKSAKEINTNVVVNLPLSEIDENPDNELIFNMDDIKALAKNIKEDGFIGAIEVYKKADGRFEISSGHRRYRAMQLLNKESIPAIVCDMPSDIKKRKTLIASNINTREMSAMDIARAIKYHYDTLKLENNADNKLNALSEYFNMTVMNITRYLKLIDLNKGLQELVAKKLVPWSSIILCADKPEAIQEKIHNDISVYLNDHDNKITGTVVENIINKYDKKKNKAMMQEQPVDKQMFRIHRLLRQFSQRELYITNKENMRKQISEIEEYIKLIKKQL